ncbi:DUF2510 domain-containing protein [Microbacterium sp. NPDC028030]|uniref:DUF2510 domain-containing protein n=1 Tax=Microbacterium sp. NPDC028030 TaxID=3155124 RepID=UPI0033F34A88
MTTTPAGWYDDGSGRQRWWDGQQWTEHFAPDAAAPADQTSAAAPETPTVEDTVIRPSEESATAATTPLGDDFGAYAPPAASPTDPAAQPQGVAPGYPGAYTGAANGYPGTAPAGPTGPDAPVKVSVLGLVGLGLAALGTILVFIPVIGVVGFFLLAAGFIVSLISLFLKGKKWPGITGLALSVVGTIIGVIVSFVFLFAVAQGVSNEIDDLPSSSPSVEATEPSDTGDADGTDQGVRPTSAEVAVGLAAILAAEDTDIYTEEQITCLADLLVASELDNDALRAIAESDGTLTDVDAAYGFAEVLGDTEALTACFVP